MPKIAGKPADRYQNQGCVPYHSPTLLKTLNFRKFKGETDILPWKKLSTAIPNDATINLWWS